MSALIIIGGIVLILLFSVIGIYNGMVKKRNQVENAFGSMDTSLKQRFDLIPNLVETVKQYMTHEKETLTKITELRSQNESKNLSDDQKIDLDNKLSNMMGKIMVTVENYPDLKANQNFIQLQGTWNEVEGQIAASRRFYNSAVTTYNDSIQIFPNSIFAGMFGFQKKNVFEISEAERQNVNAKDLWA